MSQHELYNIAISLIPQEIIDKYKSPENQIDSFVYVRVKKGMYGLVQARIISHMDLKKYMFPFWIWTCTHHISILEAKNEYNHLHNSGRWLWHNIPEKWGFRTIHKFTSREIWGHTRLEREPLQWHNT